MPGLLYGRESAEDFWDDLEAVLRDVDAPAIPRALHLVVPVGKVDGTDVSIVVPQDAHNDERSALVDRFLRIIDDDVQALDFVSEATFRLPTGEILVFAALLDDRVGLVSGALFPTEAALVICPFEDGLHHGMWMVTVASDRYMDDDDPRRLLAKTLPDTATIAELIETLPSGESDQRRQLVTVA